MAILPRSMTYLDEVGIDDEILEQDGFCEYAYDFENNRLKTKNGRHYYVYGNEAMKIWIYKAIISSRFKHSAYTDRFGTEIYSLIGEVISSKFKEAEIKRYIIEAIMVHPFMVSINRIDMKPYKSGLNVDVYYTTVFDDEIVRVTCKVKIE